MTKKILFGILTFLGIGLSFCSADCLFTGNQSNDFKPFYVDTSVYGNDFGYCIELSNINGDFNINSKIGLVYATPLTNSYNNQFGLAYYYSGLKFCGGYHLTSSQNLRLIISSVDGVTFDYCVSLYTGDSLSSSSSSINVFYNGFNDVESFTCDGDTSIYLDGNYNYTSSNSLFSPYINIHYTDSDNQVLTGEYDKTDLFLNGQYNKTYTGGSNNYWVFDTIESPNLDIISYQPTFDVEFTGDIIDTGNIFNNFAENSLKFTLSNVPNYIQYVIIIMLLFFILGFIRKFRRK